MIWAGNYGEEGIAKANSSGKIEFSYGFDILFGLEMSFNPGEPG
jgi:hypothetical protein